MNDRRSEKRQNACGLRRVESMRREEIAMERKRQSQPNLSEKQSIQEKALDESAIKEGGAYHQGGEDDRSRGSLYEKNEYAPRIDAGSNGGALALSGKASTTKKGKVTKGISKKKRKIWISEGWKGFADADLHTLTKVFFIDTD